MRILALNWRCLRHPQAGGGEVNLFEQARRWARDGHQVTVLCADPGRQYAPDRDEVDQGVRIVRRGGRFGVYGQALLHALRSRRAYDAVLDVSNGIPFFTPLAGVPSALLVHHVHGAQWFVEFSRPVAVFGQFLERVVVPWLYRRRPVIAVSPTTEEALVALGYRPDQLQVIYNGVDLPPAEQLGSPRAGRVLYLGRLRRYKRVERLLRAVVALSDEHPDIHLDIAGDGDARPELEALTRQLDLGDRVTIHGFVDDATKARLLREATVFATPSMHEGWGLSVIEANAWGCPAVAYDVPGLRVAIRHGETGLLAQDDAGFIRAIGSLLGASQERQRVGMAARRWAGHFSWETAARQTLGVLAGAARTTAVRLDRGRAGG